MIKEEFYGYFVYLFNDYKNSIVKDFENVDVDGNIRKLFKEEDYIKYYFYHF